MAGNEDDHIATLDNNILL